MQHTTRSVNAFKANNTDVSCIGGVIIKMQMSAAPTQHIRCNSNKSRHAEQRKPKNTLTFGKWRHSRYIQQKNKLDLLFVKINNH